MKVYGVYMQRGTYGTTWRGTGLEKVSAVYWDLEKLFLDKESAEAYAGKFKFFERRIKELDIEDPHMPSI